MSNNKVFLFVIVAILIVSTAAVLFFGKENASYPTLAEYNDSIDYTCVEDTDCVVKDIGNCCGIYNACVNKDSVADRQFVRSACGREGQASFCTTGIAPGTACGCINGKCQNARTE